MLMLLRTLGGSIHTLRKSTEPVVITSKETRLEVKAEETKHAVTSQERNTGQ